MPGNGQTLNDRHGSSSIQNESLVSIKDIAQIKAGRARRLNDYTTIPRQSRGLSADQARDCVLNLKPLTCDPRRRDHVPSSTGSDRLICSEDFGETKPCCQEDRKSRDDLSAFSKSHDHGKVISCDRKQYSLTFSKLKNAFRNLKLDKPNKNETNVDGRQVRPASGGQLSSGSCCDVAGDVYGSDAEDDIYADIDKLRSSCSLRDIPHTSRSVDPGSNMTSVVTSQYRDTKSCRVLKALSSLSKLNINTRKRTARRLGDQEPAEAVYRGSFKEKSQATGKRLANSDCKRCKSFTSSPGREAELPVGGGRIPERDDGDRAGVLYSLARATDEPPPLPERTYLKLRRPGSAKENDDPDSGTGTSGGEHRTPRFNISETNNNERAYKPASYPNTIPEHVRLRPEVQSARTRDWPKSSSLSSSCKHVRTEAGQRHSAGSDHTLLASSSGYGSVTDGDHDLRLMPPPPIPPPISTLPSRRPAASGSRASGADRTAVDVRDSRPTDASSASVRSDPDDDEAGDDKQTPHGLTPSVIHNLPLPPGPGGAQLVRTLRLDGILKNRWISGIAVTRKNEYLVVDEREAYLLNEDGALKRTIGAKGSSRLMEPFDVAVMTSNGNLVICDHGEQDVKIFTPKGQFVRRVRDPGLTNIAGVAVTDFRHIVVAGTDKRRVSVLSEEGALLDCIPSGASGGGGAAAKTRTPFEHPYSVAVNPLTSDIIVGDDYKQIVTALSYDGRHGQEARVLWRYCPGAGDRHFFPSSICADSKGYIFIADLYNERVYMLDSSGKYVKTLLSRGDGLKGGPGAIATDGRGHLLVADEERTIKVFRYRDDNGFAVSKRYSYCP